MVRASWPSRAVSTTQPNRPRMVWADRRRRSSLSATRMRRPLSRGWGPAALDVKGADDLVFPQDRHREGAARPAGPLDVERVRGGVGAEVALARGGHEPRDAVALRPGVEPAPGGLGRHADRQERLEQA